MRKIIVCLATTLDGYIAGPNDEMDWLVRDESIDFGDILADILKGIDTIFYGRVSYDLWGNYQPENASPKLKDAYKLLHSKTKYVFSKTKKQGDGKAIFINSNIKEKVTEMLNQPGENIWLYGGGKIVSTFVNLNLVHAYRLAVHPVIIGAGTLLFNDIKQKSQLQLIRTESSPKGVISLNYETKNAGSL
jgi:dihydrofolate reductase